ncbi:MAG: DNA polymerase I [Anaerolineales bacterium]|nr:DNA polymerase I [Anaerolineales bacterium]
MPPILYLIDGHALAYRMYFALTAGGGNTSRWQTSKGESTAGIYGFARELMRILEQEKPEYLAIAFDTGKTFRDKLFPEYKATRAKMPDDLREQISHIREMVDAFNIPRLEVEGFEADDILGTVAKQATGRGLGVKIITGDRDLLQLVGERTAVYLAGDDQTYITDADVVRKLGVRPEQVVDYKAIVGDASDNIPGVKGVGEKTAVGLLEKFGTLDSIYAHLDEVEKRWKAKLEESKDTAYLSYDLAKIKTDVNITFDLEKAKAHDFDTARLMIFFERFEFKSLIKSLERLSGAASAPTTSMQAGQQMSMFENVPLVVVAPRIESNLETVIVDSPENLKALVSELNAAKLIAFDTETTSTEEMRAEIVGLSLAVKEGQGYYIPVGHSSGTNLPLEDVIEALRAPMTNPKIGKTAHHAKYDFIMLAKLGLRVSPLTCDTMLAEFIVDPASRNLGLKNLAFARLGDEMTHIEDLIGKGKKQISMAEVAIESAAAYAAADAEVTLRLAPVMQAELRRIPGGERLLEEIDLPLTPVLADMEMEGVMLDLPFLKTMSVELAKRLAEIEKQVYEMVGRAFNINSTQQLSDVLFNKLGLKADASWKTASGHYSTNASVLEALAGQHPVVDLILEQRELSKLKSTYLDALPEAADPATHRVHTSYSQIGAVTGRLSSNNPNLQNIPIRTELGRKVRNAFIAPQGSALISIDYSQIELRIAAHMSGDESMQAAFRAGQDIHATTAAAIYNIPLEKVTRDMRRHAKAINFGLIYGMSAFGLTRSTELTLAEAEDFVKAYFEKFPGVKRYLDGIRKSAAADGYVETLLGRRRYFPALKSQMNKAMKNREEREAINAPIQGTAADIMKIAMLKIPHALAQAKLNGKMLLQVHDELVIECPQAELNETVRVVRQVMESAYPLNIPLETEARAGSNWGEMVVVS